jgi:hypothetical protein
MKFHRVLYNFNGHVDGFFMGRRYFIMERPGSVSIGEWKRSSLVRTYKHIGRMSMDRSE